MVYLLSFFFLDLTGMAVDVGDEVINSPEAVLPQVCLLSSLFLIKLIMFAGTSGVLSS